MSCGVRDYWHVSDVQCCGTLDVLDLEPSRIKYNKRTVHCRIAEQSLTPCYLVRHFHVLHFHAAWFWWSVIFTSCIFSRPPYVYLSNACIVTKRKHLAKKVQIWLIGSRLWAFQWAQDEQRTLPLSPQWGSKMQIGYFPSKSYFSGRSLLPSFFVWKLSAAEL